LMVDLRGVRAYTSAGGQTDRVPLLVSCPVGVISGAMGALCGVGGGVLIIPALRQTTQLSQHIISGTSLAAVTLASTVGAAAYASQGVANLPVAACLASTSILTAGLGVRAGKRLSDRHLTRVVGFSLLIMSPLIAFKKHLRSAEQPVQPVLSVKPEIPQERKEVSEDSGFSDFAHKLSRYSCSPVPDTLPKVLEYLKENYNFILAGCATGFASGLLGLGGGIVMTTYMAVGTNMSQHEAVATSIFAMVPTGVSASFFHVQAGNVKMRAAGALAASCAAGMFITSTYVTAAIPEDELRYIFAMLLAVSSSRMVMI